MSNEGSDDVHAWEAHESAPTWIQPRELVDAPKWDAGGAALVPEAQLPIFLTDPFGTSTLGQAWRPTYGYGLQWHVGFTFGRLSLEPLVGYAHVSRDLTVPGQGPSSASLDHVGVGGRLRLLFPGHVVSGFLGVGGESDRWNASVLARSGSLGAKIDAVWSPSAHVLAGLRVRLASFGHTATLFMDLAVQGNYFLHGDVFESDQVAVTPYVGFDLMGLAASAGASDRREQHAHL